MKLSRAETRLRACLLVYARTHCFEFRSRGPAPTAAGYLLPHCSRFLRPQRFLLLTDWEQLESFTGWEISSQQRKAFCGAVSGRVPTCCWLTAQFQSRPRSRHIWNATAGVTHAHAASARRRGYRRAIGSSKQVAASKFRARLAVAMMDYRTALNDVNCRRLRLIRQMLICSQPIRSCVGGEQISICRIKRKRLNSHRSRQFDSPSWSRRAAHGISKPQRFEDPIARRYPRRRALAACA